MEYLDIVIMFVCCAFEIYIYHDFFHAYFDYRNDDVTQVKRFVRGVVATIILFMLNMNGNSYVNIIGVTIIVWSYCLLVFRAKLGSRLLYFLIALIVGWGCEFLFGFLVSVPAFMEKGQSVVKLSEIPWQMFTMKLLTYMIFSVIKHFSGKARETIDDKVFVYYLCIPAASIVIMLLTYYSGVGEFVDGNIKLLSSLSFAFMLFGNIFVFRAFVRHSEEMYVNAEQKLIISRQAMDLQYYDRLQRSEVRQRDFIHNITHHLRTIGELAKENQNDNILSVLQDLNIEIENSVLTSYCDNSVVNAILSEKQSVAEKHDINMDIYVEPGVTLSRIPDADIITMLSNLLDNALRAAMAAEDKSILVRIYLENKGRFHVIKIENHFAGEILSTASGFVSTKKEEGVHGIGIKSVKKTAEKYDGYLECFIEDMLFTAVLILPA